MKAYRHSVRLKLGLILFAVLIAVASLVYTNVLVERLREREQFVMQLWASAQEHLASTSREENPYIEQFRELDNVLVDAASTGASIPEGSLRTYLDALSWARSMPPSSDVTLASEIVLQGRFGIPAIVTDSAMTTPIFWQSVPAPDSLGGLAPDEEEALRSRLIERARTMAQEYEPIEIALGTEPNQLTQYIFYDDSQLVRELTIFPYIQLLFVALFIAVGYLGFSYVRRSEQSSLWVGMAKEAAHQLGTPISSLMGWTELLKESVPPEGLAGTALEEIDNDIARLQRVTARFSDIGSLPKLDVQDVKSVIQATADYITRRLPKKARQVELNVDVADGLYAPLNAELFEWVIENLLKNALDAIETPTGSIHVAGSMEDATIRIDVTDTGKGIDRRNWKNVFRPGYSTKKRGWGLGLSLAKRIVEDYHGGTLTLAQSRPGEGSTFRITLP
ncbi:MAG: HAMP domain-containing sensor histidine kinase, partial [Rhodothermales bacterium]